MCSTPRRRWSWPTLKVSSTSWWRSSSRPSTWTRPCWPCTPTRCSPAAGSIAVPLSVTHHSLLSRCCLLFTGRPVPETRIQSSVAESESPAARAHTGGSAVPREAARQSHRASAGRQHVHPPQDFSPNHTSSSLTCLIQPSKAKIVLI